MMDLKEFLEYNWNDSSIKELNCHNDYLKLRIKDWKDMIHEVEINNVFELYFSDYYDEAISHIEIINKGEFTFHSAWEEREILKVKFDV